MTPDETWAGEKGRYWAENADWFSRSLADFGEAVLEGASLQPGERVLDVGCGNGDLTVAVAEVVAPDGIVVGVDLSADQLDVAAVRAARADLPNVELRVADASADDLGPAPFDVLVSRFGVMFFDDPVTAFTNLHGALRPGGRAAFVCWQPVEQNEWIHGPRDAVAEIVPVPGPPPGQPGPWAFAEPDHVRGVLERAGFSDVGFESVERPVHLGAVPEDAVDFLLQMDWAVAALGGAPDETKDEARRRLRAVVAERALPDGRMEVPGAAWLVRATA